MAETQIDNEPPRYNRSRDVFFSRIWWSVTLGPPIVITGSIGLTLILNRFPPVAYLGLLVVLFVLLFFCALCAFYVTAVATLFIKKPHWKIESCEQCGYDLSGLESENQCPECGAVAEVSGMD